MVPTGLPWNSQLFDSTSLPPLIWIFPDAAGHTYHRYLISQNSEQLKRMKDRAWSKVMDTHELQGQGMGDAP
jgi:hypothetical protein